MVSPSPFLIIMFAALKKVQVGKDQEKAAISPAENKFDLKLSSKVFFFTESCSVDIACEESE